MYDLRQLQVVTPDTLSAEAMELYTNNLYYYLQRALPSLPSLLNHDLLQAIYKNTPPGYLPLADDLFLKLKMNMQVMLSMMVSR